MKKLLALMLVALVAQAHAATINWGLGADVYLMKEGSDYTTAKIAYDSDLTVDPGAYLALVYVGSGVDTFDVSTITESSVLATASYKVDTDGATYADYDPQFTATDVTDTAKYANGSSFAVVWFTGKAFDYVYSIDDGSALNQAVTVSDMVRGNETIMPAETTKGWGGVIAVPEPSTAMLALAGLALLIKRRRA